MKRLLLLKFGPTDPRFIQKHGDFEDLFIKVLGVDASDIEIQDPSMGESLPEPAEYKGILLMGSHSNVPDAHPWIETASEWIRRSHETKIPILGVCFGHQLLNHALGGVSGKNPNGSEFGTVPITTTEAARTNPLYSAMPSTFRAQVSHAQCALELPKGAVHLASSEKDPHQSFHMPPASWGVQFHPEFDAAASTHSVREFEKNLRAEGQNVGDLLKEVEETPESMHILTNFKKIMEGKR